MEVADLIPLIELLDDNIDDLEEALAPLLKGALSDAAGKLPLLDKAQLYVLVTYAIESIIFCAYMAISLRFLC
jgi:exosome complex protein LRP1